MIRIRRRFIPVFALAFLCLPVQALIKVQTPVSKMFAGSASVVAGRVTKVNADTGVIEAAATTLKGDGVGDTLKVKLDSLPDVLKNVKEGSPLVLFVGRRTASNALSLDDAWLFPNPSSKANFVVTKELDLRQSFPGSTAALARVVDELKSGHTSMLDEVSPDMFKGAQKPLGNVPAGATAAYTFKGPGAKSQTLVLVTPAGPQYFVADATGLKPAEPVKADRPKLPSGRDAGACAFGNFGEDDKICAVCVENNDLVRQPLDGQGPTAGFLRLTGERITSYHKDHPTWLTGATLTALDCNGDGKVDLFLSAPAGPMLLINRGYGAFFIDADIAKVLKTPAGTSLLTPKSLCAGYDLDGDGLDDLLIISDTGAVTAVMNPKPEKKP